MAKYTMLLCDLMNNLCDKKYNPMDVNEMAFIIRESWDKVFISDFPIWDKDYAEILCKKILAHYYMQEIGSETPALFIFRINRKMNEIMPYYKLLYKSIITDIEGVMGIDLLETFTEKSRGSSANKEQGRNEKSQADNKDSNGGEKYTSEEIEGRKENSSDKKEFAGSEESTTHDGGSVDVTNTGNQSTERTATENDIYNSSMEKSYGHSERTDYDIKNQKSGKDTNNQKIDGLQKFQDTPQGSIDNLRAGKYLSNATIAENEVNSTDNYGSGETKSGWEKRTFEGSDTDTHSGKDTIESSGGEIREDNLRRLETRNLDTSGSTEIANIESSSRSLGAEMQRDESSKKEINSSEEYISNILEQMSKRGGERHRELREYERRTNGRNGGDWIEQIMKWRESMINIDMMIIEDLQPLFMGIW